MTNEEMEQLKNLQEQIADLKAEIAKLNAQNGNDADAKAMTVLDAMDETTEDRDLKVETLCRWAAARAGAIVIAPLVGTVAQSGPPAKCETDRYICSSTAWASAWPISWKS